MKIFVTLFSENLRPRKLKLRTHVDSGQMYRVYQNRPFISSFYFFSNFQTLKYFVIIFSGTVRPRILKLSTYVDSGQMYRIYRNQAAAAYSSRYSSVFFLSNFQTLKFFDTRFSGAVRPRRLSHGTQVDNGQMYRIYRNRAAVAYSSLYFSFFFLYNFQTLKFFVTLFSGTMRPRRLKLVTYVDSGQLYRVYWNQAATLIHPFISSFFFPIFEH